MKLPCLRFAGVFSFAALASLSASWGSLLLYEGFDYTAGSTLNNITPNASTVGLNKTVAYAGNGASNYTVQASSLSLGSLQVSGGAIQTAAATSVAAGKMSAASYSGTLWSSYLVSLSSTGTAASDGAVVRLSNDTTNGAERFNAYADNRLSTGGNAAKLGLSYNAANNATVGSTGLDLNTTYIIISSYSNVGSSVAAGTGTARLWALSASQFGSFVAAGRTEAYLTSASVGMGASQVTGAIANTNSAASTYTFASGNYADFVSVNDTTTFDELRYGSTLLDVTPVPEPVALALLPAALLLCSMRTSRSLRRFP